MSAATSILPTALTIAARLFASELGIAGGDAVLLVSHLFCIS